MTELTDNLDVLVKRRIHVSFMQGRDIEAESSSVFHVQTSNPKIQCTGCNKPHRFGECNRYRARQEKINRLWQLDACHICFSKRHRTYECRKPKCFRCGGPHNLYCVIFTNSIADISEVGEAISEDTLPLRTESLAYKPPTFGSHSINQPGATNLTVQFTGGAPNFHQEDIPLIRETKDHIKSYQLSRFPKCPRHSSEITELISFTTEEPSHNASL
ncbi:hypothetical protein GCK32_000101 [Trichostrongylus colubriformis]|uniref:Uncharacterized protein n=1 Tax=Trichostrongylus colubriformis TaxID=6319 RepID=A0AAN8FPY3_TRICO